MLYILKKIKKNFIFYKKMGKTLWKIRATALQYSKQSHSPSTQEVTLLVQYKLEENLIKSIKARVSPSQETHQLYKLSFDLETLVYFDILKRPISETDSFLYISTSPKKKKIKIYFCKKKKKRFKHHLMSSSNFTVH